MSKLSRHKALKRKRHRLKKGNKPEGSVKTPVLKVAHRASFGVDYNPVVITTHFLKITKVLLKNNRHAPITVAGFGYQSVADFSVHENLHKYWGGALEITRDIHGNYIVYWKERFPLFDVFDFQHDDRHYRVMLICSTRQEAEEKMRMLNESGLAMTRFGHDGSDITDRFGLQYRQLLPFVYYEDSGQVIALEAIS